LEGEEESLAGAVLGFHGQQVLSVERHLSLGDFIEGVAHKHGGERALP
jgi:hypothetical protein